ncbi:MAG: cysteine--tRNA ligase [Candidatus Moranbacteria bacterium]|nr:cysteine--tRNA ligase [Candidatus Moranbacteria bacterium]
MPIKLYNTLTNKKEIFKPIEKGKVKMYSCGPTVYDYASIGNMWSYLTADILRRTLEYFGFEIRQIKNITDVGHFSDDEQLSVSGQDKMEKAAKREKKTPLELAEYYLNFFLIDEKKLNIKPPHFQPRPTQEIPQIIKIIQELEKKGYCYQTDDGVYFSVKKFKDYGKLSGNTLKKIRSGARVEINENKKDPADFALWIKRVGKNKKHTLFWDSPWGRGFPGWHIECTAMAVKYLGHSIDIHTGGEDNIFPHHECEIAQSESFSDKKFVNYWIHTRHFLINSKKMSKSKGNIFTISKTPDNRYKSLEEMGFHPLAFRTLKLGAHYRSQANFTLKAMEQAQKNWEKINQFYLRILKFNPREKKQNLLIDAEKTKKDFDKAMADDLNTPQALKSLLALIKKANSAMDKDNLANFREIITLIKKFDKILAILDLNYFSQKKEIPKKILALAEQRQLERQNKNFANADQIRKQIKNLGYELIDKGKKGFEIKRKK